jgi:hypothetical protein
MVHAQKGGLEAAEVAAFLEGLKSRPAQQSAISSQQLAVSESKQLANGNWPNQSSGKEHRRRFPLMDADQEAVAANRSQ